MWAIRLWKLVSNFGDKDHEIKTNSKVVCAIDLKVYQTWIETKWITQLKYKLLQKDYMIKIIHCII